MFNRLIRDRGPVSGNVFVVMPFGKRDFHNDQGDVVHYDFDEHYHEVLVPVIEGAGLNPVRTDSLYDGGDTVLDNVWARLQEGQIVIVDLTGSNRNVMIEFAWAYLLNKPIIPLTQCAGDVPSDLPGLRYISYSQGWKDMERMKGELRSRLDILREEAHAELRLVPMATSTIRPVPARVVNVSREHVVVEAEKGQYGVLGPADVDLTRIVSDMAQRFSAGEVLDGAFETSDGHTRYTLVAGQSNPWPQLAADFPSAHVFTGKVVNVVAGVGAFVHVAHGVNGLIPAAALKGVRLTVGTKVTAGVVKVDPRQRRIHLALVEADERRVTVLRPQVAVPHKRGERCDAEVVKVMPEQGRSGGYALVELPGSGRTAMLHCTDMSPEVRADLNRGRLERGELLAVEITDVNEQGRIRVRDLEGETEAPAELAA
ncbi:S1 RNA-binding domain-containing protein [Micromonospora sp. NPDC005367]|uniref:S1 RNA-binding domain-containing protein n=1 Tax=Micromonospora sp. NPDC005367 TaxID=3155590 RepID=UPI0033B11DCB